MDPGKFVYDTVFNELTKSGLASGASDAIASKALDNYRKGIFTKPSKLIKEHIKEGKAMIRKEKSL